MKKWWNFRDEPEGADPEGAAATGKSSRAGRSLVDDLPVAVFTMDAAGKLLNVNARLQSLLRRRADELMGLELADLLIPHERDLIRRVIAKTGAEEPEPTVVVMTVEGRTRSFELHLQTKRNARGTLLGFSGVLHDVSTRQRSRENLQDKLDFSARLLEISPVALFAKDVKGRHLFVNGAFMELIGLPEGMIIGATSEELLGEDDGRSKASDLHVLETGEITSYESGFQDANGKRKTVLVTKTRLTRGNGQAAGIVGSVQDVTLYRQAEQAILAGRDAMVRAAKTKLDFERSFLSMAAHELRTPMTGLRLQAELVTHAENNSDRLARGRELIASVDRASHVLEQLMVLSRVDGMKYSPLDIQPVNLENVYLKVMSQVQEEAAQRGLRMKARLSGLQVQGVEFGIFTLMRNLVHNAIIYTPPGGQILVAAAAADAGEGMRLTVDDSGPGIPEDKRAKAFDRFDRLGQQSVKGSGLGLSIVKNLAALHGATVALGTSPLGGLRVTVQFSAAPIPHRQFLDSNLSPLQ